MQSVLNEESIFDTINSVLKTVNSITNRDDKGKNNKKSAYYLGGSISRYAKNLTMSFPVLVDDSLSIETAQMISKANEKNIASMLELLFASMSINGTKGMTGKDVVGLFHKNIDDMSADDYIDYANDVMANYVEACYLPSITDAQVRDIQREMCYQLKQPKKSFPISSFSERSLNDYMCRDMYNGTMVYEHHQVVKEDASEEDKLLQLNRDKFTYQQQKDMGLTYDKDYALRYYQDRYNRSRDNIIDKQKDREFKQRRRMDVHQLHKDADDKERNRMRDMSSDLRDMNSLNQRRVIDSEFKKANELQPTMMIVNFNILSDDGKSVVDRKSFVAGIKCRMIATSSMDIAERLLATNKTQTSFKNFIRATTGEIKFGRDFIAAVDQQKLDAINDVKKGEAAKLWSTLKKRSVKSNVRSIKRDSNDATSITTLVISQDTANFMKSESNFDVSIPKNAKMIMDRYNFLCLVIADETNEVAKFMYDGNSDFESISYLVLAREAKDKELRKATDLLYKGGR